MMRRGLKRFVILVIGGKYSQSSMCTLLSHLAEI
jgi:hypothetical protein